MPEQQTPRQAGAFSHRFFSSSLSSEVCSPILAPPSRSSDPNKTDAPLSSAPAPRNATNVHSQSNRSHAETIFFKHLNATTENVSYTFACTHFLFPPTPALPPCPHPEPFSPITLPFVFPSPAFFSSAQAPYNYATFLHR